MADSDWAAEAMQAAVQLRRRQPAQLRALGGKTVHHLMYVTGANVQIDDVILAEVGNRLQLGRVTDVRRNSGQLKLGMLGWTTYGCVFGRVVR